MGFGAIFQQPARAVAEFMYPEIAKPGKQSPAHSQYACGEFRLIQQSIDQQVI
jgi:hypothetical protein